MSDSNTRDISFGIEIGGYAPTVFRVIAFNGDETLSSPFIFKVVIACESNKTIRPAELLEKTCDLTIYHKYHQLQADDAYEIGDGMPVPPRVFNGVIESIEHLSTNQYYSQFQITVMPALHRLRHTSDCKIYQGKTVEDIVKEILSEKGVQHFQFNLREKHIPREFCVQYNESHLGFIQRLLAEEGILYYFKHEKGMHTLVMTDISKTADKIKPSPIVEYHDNSGGMIKKQYINQFNWREILRTTQFVQREYCFKNPTYNQEHIHSIPKTSDGTAISGTYEKYHYHARYKESAQGKPFTQYRLEAEQADMSQGGGSSNLPHLSAGWGFTLKRHPVESYDRDYLLVSVSHSGTQPQALEHLAGGGAATYNNSFTVVEDILPSWRPPMWPKPVIHGTQMAHVVGPPGEEIYTDEHGRVKLHFPWDRYSTKDDKSSCWVRVSQAWAGSTWGFVSIPRIGHEVIVDFLEGDPDQPIVIGRTYHANNKVPYALPGNKTQTGLKSRSSPGGGGANFNELRFEDKKGQEQIYIHAEKNQDNIVENDETTDVGRDRTENVHRDETITIDRDRTETVHHDEKITIDNNRTESVGVDETIGIGNNRTESVGNSESISVGNNQQIAIGSNRSENVGANESVSIGANRSVNIGANKTETIGQNKAETIAIAKALTVGAGYQVSVGASKNVTVGLTSTEQVGMLKHIIAGQRYELVVGSSSLILNADGTIILSGKEIKIEGSKHVEVISKLVDIN